MADDDLIDTYLADLRASVTWRRDADDIVAEAEDHIRSHVERLVAGGLAEGDAQRLALARFGDALHVARAHAMSSRGKLAVPTTTTRDAGVIAIVSGFLWCAHPIVWVLGGWVYDRVGPDNPGDELGSSAQLAAIMVMGLTLLAAAASMLATTLALNERHGGFRLPGMIGIGAVCVGAMASLFGWFFLGWASVLLVGTVLVSVELWYGGTAPKMWVAVTGSGLAIGVLLWGVLRSARVGWRDEFGDYPVADISGRTAGSLILGIGLIGIGRWLRAETPALLVAPRDTATA